MKITIVLCPDSEAARLPAAIDLITLALLRSRMATPLDAGAPASVYADMRRQPAESRS